MEKSKLIDRAKSALLCEIEQRKKQVNEMPLVTASDGWMYCDSIEGIAALELTVRLLESELEKIMINPQLDEKIYIDCFSVEAVKQARDKL